MDTNHLSELGLSIAMYRPFTARVQQMGYEQMKVFLGNPDVISGTTKFINLLTSECSRRHGIHVPTFRIRHILGAYLIINHPVNSFPVQNASTHQLFDASVQLLDKLQLILDALDQFPDLNYIPEDVWNVTAGFMEILLHYTRVFNTWQREAKVNTIIFNPLFRLIISGRRGLGVNSKWPSKSPMRISCSQTTSTRSKSWRIELNFSRRDMLPYLARLSWTSSWPAPPSSTWQIFWPEQCEIKRDCLVTPYKTYI